MFVQPDASMAGSVAAVVSDTSYVSRLDEGEARVQ